MVAGPPSTGLDLDRWASEQVSNLSRIPKSTVETPLVNGGGTVGTVGWHGVWVPVSNDPVGLGPGSPRRHRHLPAAAPSCPSSTVACCRQCGSCMRRVMRTMRRHPRLLDCGLLSSSRPWLLPASLCDRAKRLPGGVQAPRRASACSSEFAFAGLSGVVFLMILLFSLRCLLGFLPPRGRSSSMPVRPCAAKLFRHLPTVASVTPNSSAINLFRSPAAARSTICARCARRTAVPRPRVRYPNCFSLSSLSVMVVAMRMVPSALDTQPPHAPGENV